MPKGFYSQGLCILLSEPVSLDQMERALAKSGLKISGRQDGSDDELIDVPSLIMPYDQGDDGQIMISLLDREWPDDMGDPEDQPEVFVAWSLGQYGPLAYPGCLERATEQSWAWEDSGQKVGEHRCFIRVLCSYVIGVESDDAPLLPDDYDAMAELEYLTKIVSSLLELPQALCYFNPGGEVLRDEDGLREGLNYAWNHHLPALDMWTNVRLFKATDEWSLMDTVGNGQFDLPDIEAAFLTEKYDLADIEKFLRNASLTMLKTGDVFEEGDMADGAGTAVWRALVCEDALTDPPRPTIRWFPNDDTEVPEELTDTGLTDQEVEAELEELTDFDDIDFDDSDDTEYPF